MIDRRDFLKQFSILGGGAGMFLAVPPSILRAMSIDPIEGSSYLDAEHVVILMQENRSFDHSFGSLRGVRGFGDPRTVFSGSNVPTWLQSSSDGDTFLPFRLNLRDTKSTWMGDLPHSRKSQIDSYNEGFYNNWIEAKKSHNENFKDMPLTMGYYNREDLPFNYALADAFTVCDQNFSSAMTSTWPNRLFLWTGTIRERQDDNSKAYIRNDLQRNEGTWLTFPERLEDNGISWKIYQNDVTYGGGFTEEERSWLSNFGCNPMELFKKYPIEFSERNQINLKKVTKTISQEIKQLKSGLRENLTIEQKKKIEKEIESKEKELENAQRELNIFSNKAFKELSQKEKSLFNRAFAINKGDPDFRSTTTIGYKDDKGNYREMVVPKGDIFYQFRKDVDTGSLPTVSWLVAPQKYSDHPMSPWYGSYYISEVMDILTKDPEVWKKTIFILTYDENDGFFDHIPPFVPPNPHKKNSGKCSEGIDTKAEWITLQQELNHGISKKEACGGPVGLGYRVPMIIASPWSRGGKVCSEVFDHTSTLQFLEKFLNYKFKTNIYETNISKWRRTICGDISSAFSSFTEKELIMLEKLMRKPFLKGIHQAQFKNVPGNYRALTINEIESAKIDWKKLSIFPQQEMGMRPSCALPYELAVVGNMDCLKKVFELRFHVGNKRFGLKSAGAPFTVYGHPDGIRSYALTPGDTLMDRFDFSEADSDNYGLKVYGPNGFYRSFSGDKNGPDIHFWLEEAIILGNNPKSEIILLAIAHTDEPREIEIEYHAYGYPKITKIFKKMDTVQPMEIMRTNLENSFSWYDFSVKVKSIPSFRQEFAGRVETGEISMSDPQLG
ncbi:phospholipase C, phosphocholine-specific [Flavobacteriaceae bacterium F89]|uniref:phospholipase C n=1 Tax=Cerina litoralis TaxID=2874477 RepID=A0AAE3JQP8_9FLAO|nr:phospholipase C, phosphocholine-specific [Cerina litoralis]MCG2462361.1 phospholipase C, phosphocholine-specific [Cerina litoralis]